MHHTLWVRFVPASGTRAQAQATGLCGLVRTSQRTSNKELVTRYDTFAVYVSLCAHEISKQQF